MHPQHNKTNKVTVRPAKTQISLGIRSVWSESSLSAQCVAKDPRFLHADSEDSDQTGQMPRLIWVFAGRTLILLVLSRCGSSVIKQYNWHWQTFCHWAGAVILWQGKYCIIVSLRAYHEHIYKHSNLVHKWAMSWLWHFSSSVNSFFKRACAVI